MFLCCVPDILYGCHSVLPTCPKELYLRSNSNSSLPDGVLPDFEMNELKKMHQNGITIIHTSSEKGLTEAWMAKTKRAGMKIIAGGINEHPLVQHLSSIGVVGIGSDNYSELLPESMARTFRFPSHKGK
jgi:hypothetical protein